MAISDAISDSSSRTSPIQFFVRIPCRWIAIVNVPAKHQWNSSDTTAGGWEKSGLRNYMNSGFYGMLPNDLKTSIRSVNKLTNNVGDAQPATGSISSTSDKLWALSVSEIWGRQEGTGNEGTQYQYYRDAGVPAFAYGGSQLLKKSGAFNMWWLRTPTSLSVAYPFAVSMDGSLNGGRYATSALGAVPGFCL